MKISEYYMIVIKEIFLILDCYEYDIFDIYIEYVEILLLLRQICDNDEILIYI